MDPVPQERVRIPAERALVRRGDQYVIVVPDVLTEGHEEPLVIKKKARRQFLAALFGLVRVGSKTRNAA